MFLVLAIGIGLPLAGLASTPHKHVGSGVKSYREWKQAKVIEIESKIKDLKARAHMKTEAGLHEDIQSEIEQERVSLSMSRDLSISDYFVGYLAKQNSPDTAIKEVAGRLSSNEVAELMQAYAENFFQARPAPVKMAPRADSGQ